MTDKEIIIDGVDVSECDFLWKEKLPKKVCNNGNLDCNNCNSNPNCDFKQLKRKEQECENLNVVTTTQRKTNIELTVLLGEMVLKNGNLYQLQKQYRQALDEIEYQVRELFLGVENKDRPYCGNILDIINKAKDGE